jgi:Flp pilus assembly protein TadB
MRALAALLRSGLPARQALDSWHRDVPPHLRDVLVQLERLLKLGVSPGDAIRRLEPGIGPDALILADVISIHMRLGGDLATMVEGIADVADARAETVATGRAAGAGALVSARIVAGLPLLLLPLAPIARAPLIDPVGILLFLLGGALALGGMKWVTSLIPVPRLDPEGVLFAETLASVLDGGAPLHAALMALCEKGHGSTRGSLQQARRRVRLGESWSDALSHSGSEALVAIAGQLRLTLSVGSPLSAALRRWAQAERAAARRDFDTALKRAPVLMVVPLSVCVLPAYALLGLAPFLRGLL